MKYQERTNLNEWKHEGQKPIIESAIFWIYNANDLYLYYLRCLCYVGSKMSLIIMISQFPEFEVINKLCQSEYQPSILEISWFLPTSFSNKQWTYYWINVNHTVELVVNSTCFVTVSVHKRQFQMSLEYQLSVCYSVSSQAGETWAMSSAWFSLITSSSTYAWELTTWPFKSLCFKFPVTRR